MRRARPQMAVTAVTLVEEAVWKRLCGIGCVETAVWKRLCAGGDRNRPQGCNRGYPHARPISQQQPSRRGVPQAFGRMFSDWRSLGFEDGLQFGHRPCCRKIQDAPWRIANFSARSRCLGEEIVCNFGAGRRWNAGGPFAAVGIQIRVAHGVRPGVMLQKIGRVH